MQSVWLSWWSYLSVHLYLKSTLCMSTSLCMTVYMSICKGHTFTFNYPWQNTQKYDKTNKWNNNTNEPNGYLFRPRMFTRESKPNNSNLESLRGPLVWDPSSVLELIFTWELTCIFLPQDINISSYISRKKKGPKTNCNAMFLSS